MPRGKTIPGQLDLDGEPYEPPVAPTLSRNMAKPKPTWGRLVKRDKMCEDCFTDQAEEYRRGQPITLRRVARYRRTVKGGGNRLLCNAHADLWRGKDRLPALDHDKNGTRV